MKLIYRFLISCLFRSLITKITETHHVLNQFSKQISYFITFYKILFSLRKDSVVFPYNIRLCTGLNASNNNQLLEGKVV